MEGDHNESLFMRFSGTENDLNHILSTFEDSEDEIENFSTSNYVKNTAIKWEIYIAALTFGKACSLMSPDIVCGNG